MRNTLHRLLNQAIISHDNNAGLFLVAFGFLFPVVLAVIIASIIHLHVPDIPIRRMSLSLLFFWLTTALTFLPALLIYAVGRGDRHCQKLLFYGAVFSMAANHVVGFNIAISTLSCGLQPGDHFCGGAVLLLSPLIAMQGALVIAELGCLGSSLIQTIKNRQNHD
jgi:hypothetical protein